MTKTQHISAERLHAFFRPRSIALVGATDNSRWSVYTFENLKNFNFPGPIYLVNPNHDFVHGQRALKSLWEAPEAVDLAFIMVPTPLVFSIVATAAEMGTTQFVVLTSGFSEIGAEGAKLEHDLLTFAQAHAIGLSLLVSMGNESMISVTDVVDYLLEDESTRSIALFLESIRHPEELRRVADKARERQKPIVALKTGRSEASSHSALAHTGALVGNDAVNDAALRQLGILRVHSLEDLLTTAGLAGYSGPLPGRRMGVVTPAGGSAVFLDTT